ncbi:MAG TPA: hypothetical protein VM204_02000, partial [Gaiellaceae bacterium]|nr:hypothetical protein [Gaiellaceae bacterium]
MRRRPALLAIAACSAIAAALACGELIADPADAPNVDAGPDSAPADDADADAGGAVADARAFLSPRWATEVTADASMFAGATALSPRGTPMMLGTVNGTLDGVTTSDADPILLEVNADGTLAFAKVLSVKAGGQFGVASTSTSSGVFSAWLDQTDAGSVSHVSRVDPTTATPPTTIGDGGNREFVLGLADFPPGGVFYVGSNSPSKTEPARAIYGVLRANNPPQSVVSPDTSSASSVAARGDGVVVAG